MAVFKMEIAEFERLHQAIRNFPSDAETAINEVLHNDAGSLIQEEIKRLMPVSGENWKGKKPPAKTGKSLTQEKGNLYITVKATDKYHYLYFPDDGTNTRRHVGNQQFFLRGGESQQTEIIDRCINRLVNDFEQ